MVGAVDAMLKRFPRAEIKPGDMFMANDPYNGGGTHLPDVNVISPVFFEGDIVAFVANIAHHADVGGMVKVSGSRIAMPLAPPSPGSTPISTPSVTPMNISNRLNGVSATENP